MSNSTFLLSKKCSAQQMIFSKGVNSNVDSETAIHLKDIFLECVVAPSFDEEALEILKVKKNLKIKNNTSYEN